MLGRNHFIFAALVITSLMLGGKAFAQGDNTEISDPVTEARMAQAEKNLAADKNFPKFNALVAQARQMLPAKPAEAEALLLDALKLDSPFIFRSDAQELLADAYLGQRKYRACVGIYDQLIGDKSRYGGAFEAKVFADYAYACLTLGQTQRAEELINRGIKLGEHAESDEPSIPLYEIGQDYSIADIRSAIHIVRADNYWLCNDPDRAAAEYANAVKAMPQSALAHYFLGTFDLAHDKPAQAIKEFDKALRTADGLLLKAATEHRKDAVEDLVKEVEKASQKSVTKS